jgi:hypothetical protein
LTETGLHAQWNGPTPSPACRSVGTSTVVVTTDDLTVFAKRSQAVGAFRRFGRTHVERRSAQLIRKLTDRM